MTCTHPRAAPGLDACYCPSCGKAIAAGTNDYRKLMEADSFSTTLATQTAPALTVALSTAKAASWTAQNSVSLTVPMAIACDSILTIPFSSLSSLTPTASSLTSSAEAWYQAKADYYLRLINKFVLSGWSTPANRRRETSRLAALRQQALSRCNPT